MLIGEPALADLTLRYHARGNGSMATRDYGDNSFDNNYASPQDYMGPDGWWMDNGYYSGGNFPLYQTSPLVSPPVVIPPFLAQSIPHQPYQFGFIDGQLYVIPFPNIQRLIIPPYPDYLTAGSAYFPTPEYPFNPRIRFHRHQF